MPDSVSSDFWDDIQKLVNGSKIEIDRPKGSAHPTYTDTNYPFDYGYLAGTNSPDGGGIDVFIGSGNRSAVSGVICTVDMLQRNVEVKVLLGCSPEEMEAIFQFLDTDSMGCVLMQYDSQRA